jgi:sucrose phosphorylase
MADKLNHQKSMRWLGEKPESIEVTNTVHHAEPQYERPRFQFNTAQKSRLKFRLKFIYGPDAAKKYLPELERICQVYYAHKPQSLIENEQGFDRAGRFTEKDIILITYGDLIRGHGRSPLESLGQFCDSYLEGTINTLHLLPFFPYSSDRGFSVTDFETVDPNLGTWEDIWHLEKRYHLMFDAVFNHISSKSRWFMEFRNGNSYYNDFFIVFDSPDDLTPEQRCQIFRPRTSDVLTPYATINGRKYVWTTFSEDQVDLNYRSPEVLRRVLEIMLLYVRNGADILRLDAVTYLWSELGTSCAHLDQTHEIVKLMRDVLDAVAPEVAIITETNVPHQENISYFGDGTDEAQMVYNFALPPLVLHAFYRQDATELSKWADSLTLVSPYVTFFNFLDSHDGIGLMGVKDILPQEEIDYIIQRAQEHGGLISYKTGQSGQDEPYEINVTWYSALNNQRDLVHEDEAFQVKRLVASRIIALIIQGVPGVYLHSLIGTRNDIEAVSATHSKRDINRRVIDENLILEALDDPLSKVSRISRELGRLLVIRTAQPAFHPNADQKILYLASQLFAVLRTALGGTQKILALVNVSNQVCKVEVPLSQLESQEEYWFDLVSEMEYAVDEGKLFLSVLPYDVVWLEPRPETSDDL